MRKSRRYVYRIYPPATPSVGLTILASFYADDIEIVGLVVHRWYSSKLRPLRTRSVLYYRVAWYHVHRRLYAPNDRVAHFVLRE